MAIPASPLLKDKTNLSVTQWKATRKTQAMPVWQLGNNRKKLPKVLICMGLQFLWHARIMTADGQSL
ncbi:MAG: hypothetical protein R3B84_22210 [Zavarzinella sp.]